MAHNRIRFDKLDSDGDGAISPAEYGARLTAMFIRMDANQDGVLTGDELPQRMGRHGGHGGYRHGHGHGHGNGHENGTAAMGLQQPGSPS